LRGQVISIFGTAGSWRFAIIRRRKMSDENDFQNAYIDYPTAMLRATVKNELGDLENGATFHIGNGVVVTARHHLDQRISLQNVSAKARHC
jgi:hypothetical protein